MNLGGIYKDLGNLDQALASTLKSLEFNPDNPGFYNPAYTRFNLDQAPYPLSNHSSSILITPVPS